MASPSWIGLDNFRRMLKDPSIPKIAWNVLRLPLYLVPAHVIFSLLMAYGVYRIPNKLFKGICRTAIYFPAITTTASVAIAWGYIFNKDFGLLNWALRTIGLISQNIPWTTSSRYAMPAIVIFSIWKFTGLHFIYYLIGLENVSTGYYEAATVDGAGKMKQFFSITLPLLSPSMFFCIIMALINAFQLFPQVQIMTEGGPNGATQVMVERIYTYGFKYFKMGYASAYSWLLFVIIFALTLVQMKLQNKWVHYES